MLKVATKFAPTETAFDMAAAAGFECAELWTDPRVLADWPRVAALARRYPLQYAIHFPNRKDLGRETLEHVVTLYRELGCRALVIHQPHFDLYGEALRELGPHVCLAIENHRLNPDDWNRWFQESPYLTLDIEHAWKYTLADASLPRLLDTLQAQLERHGHKLRHVHLPGYLPGYDEHRPMYAARELVFPVLDLLASLRYEGFIVSEIDLKFQTANDLRMDALLFETWRQAETCRRSSAA